MNEDEARAYDEDRPEFARHWVVFDITYPDGHRLRSCYPEHWFATEAGQQVMQAELFQRIDIDLILHGSDTAGDGPYHD